MIHHKLGVAHDPYAHSTGMSIYLRRELYGHKLFSVVPRVFVNRSLPFNVSFGLGGG